MTETTDSAVGATPASSSTTKLKKATKLKKHSKRPHVAKGARVAAAGIGATAVMGLVGAMGLESRQGEGDPQDSKVTDPTGVDSTVLEQITRPGVVIVVHRSDVGVDQISSTRPVVRPVPVRSRVPVASTHGSD